MENKIQKYLSEKTLLNLFKAFCFINGIRKGKRFILYQSGYKNKDGGGIVCWAEVVGFTAVKVTDSKVGYDVELKLYNHDLKFANEIGAKDTYIEQDFFNKGFYPIRTVKAFLKAQLLLKMNFSHLVKPF